MGGHPPSRDHVSLGVTSRHVGQIGSYIICEHWEGSSHQDLSCSRVAAETREELLCCFVAVCYSQEKKKK